MPEEKIETESAAEKHAAEAGQALARAKVEPAARRALRRFFAEQGKPFSRDYENTLVAALTDEECGTIKEFVGEQGAGEAIADIVSAAESRLSKPAE